MVPRGGVQQYSRISPKVDKVVSDATPLLKQGIDEIGKVASPLAERFRGEALPQITVRLCPLPLMCICKVV